MKFYSVAVPFVLSTILSINAFGEARNLNAVRPRGHSKGHSKGDQEGRDNNSGAYEYGYRLAYELWENGSYRCTHDEVNNSFRPDVRDEVYDECEDTYWNWSDREWDCKEGADDFVLDQLSKCSTPSECKDAFGNTAAREVASALCPVGGGSSKSSRPQRFDSECEEHAKIRCYDEVVTLIESWCRNPEDFSLRELKELCDEKIEDLIE